MAKKKKHSTNRKGDMAEYYAVTWQIKAGVQLLLYLPDTRKLRWVEHNEKK